MALIRATHPYAYRSGEWAEITGTTLYMGRDCWTVRFPDGITDYWLTDDSDEPEGLRYDYEYLMT